MEISKLLIVDPIDGEYTGKIIINNGKIEKIIKTEDSYYDYILMPGFIDTHTHGYGGIDTMTATEKDFKQWAEMNFKHGVTTFFPTTVSASKEQIKNVIKNTPIEKSIKGIHLEGPYININKKGAQNPEYIRNPEKNEIKEILNEKIKLITMAPEIKGFYDVINIIHKNNTVISLGHTEADYQEFKKAYEKGINRITHFPNAIKGLHHRELGGVGAGMLEDFKIEMIVDGVHTSPDFVKLIYKIKNIDDIILITDSMSAAGLNDGKYDLGGLEVTVKNGKATLKDGTIAGSTLVFDKAIKNFKKFTNCTLTELAKVSSYNAAQNLKLQNLGRIKEGYIANLVLLDKNLNLKKTIFEGNYT
ncbi:N-acetylglucosamine-6-phosphate deacetylase [Marinitoga sp. 1137]|uniref:N-acetylglucosamine-6-phosphate deacetylase n=1 Tax=Marinitoga sp. 1137 TaxID=1545835 RepID=UPI0009505EA6|nr:N-acetylglucosamine-6-phosphate deacetylase [Marinitoga sp. 1137]APT76141.1 N-acetylglucosamine-6-phosphate deacetylase [Marinitoga sp. 1137]